MRRPGALLLLALAAAPAARAQTVPVRLAGDLSSLVGMPFDVPIVADWSARSDRLGSFALRLSWNPAVLRFDGGSNGSFGDVTGNLDSVALGVLRVSGANPAGVAGVITLGIGRFTPLTASNTTVQLQVLELFAAAPSFADLFSAAAPANGLFCPARGFWGDPDLDRTANSRDALLVLSAAVGLDVSAYPEIGLGDVDADAQLRARDALIILSHTVGLDVSPFRILRLALGSCGSDVTTTYAVSPGSETLVPNLEIQFELRAMSAGAVRTLPDVFWRSSAPGVVVVAPSGEAFAVAPGTATIVGKSGSRDSATATITVVARRSRHVVQASAISATNRLGTATFPFATLGEASGVAKNGDTVSVKPGRYEDPAAFDSSIVILGETVGSDGAVVAGTGSLAYGAGLTLGAGARSEVHDLTIEGFSIGIHAGAVDTLLVDSLRYLGPAAGCADAAISTQDIAVLIMRRSQLVGDGQFTGCADGIAVNGNARLIVVEDSRISDFGDDGIYANNVDSIAVRRSQIHDNYYYGVDVSAYAFGGFGRIPPAASVALVVENSQFLRNYYEAVYGADLRSGLLSHTVIDMLDYDDALSLSGTATGSGYVKLVADSIKVSDWDWIDAYNLDSVVVDSVRVVGPYNGYFGNVKLVRASTSSFVNVQSSALSFGYTGGRLVADSLFISGDPTCAQCADGIDAYSTAATVGRFRGDNLYYAIYVTDSSATVTDAVITNTYRGVYANGPYFLYGPPSRVTARRVTMTDVQYGIGTYRAVTVADDLTLTRGYEGVYTYGGGADTVRGSTIADYNYSIDLEDSVVFAASNTVQRPRYVAIYTLGSGVLTDSAVVVDNAIACDAAGADNADAIDAYYSNHRIQGNTAAGCNGGIYVESGVAGLRAVVRGNAVTIPAAADYPGIQVGAPYRAEVVGNVVTGGAPLADGSIYLRGTSFGRMPVARVDSNTVRQAQVWGIRAEYVDSLLLRRNLVEDVTVPCCYTNPGGITLYGNTPQRALIAGNTLRRVHGRGMSISQFDTATVVVDSNAVSGADTAALWLDAGKLSMTRNNVRNNARYGVFIPGIPSGVNLNFNAFKGNGLYAVSALSGSVNAQNNWWGVNGALPGTAGTDSVSGPVDGSSPLPTEPTDVPALAPPLVAAAPWAVAPWVTAARDAGGVPAEVSRTPERPTLRVAPVRSPKPPRAERAARATGDAATAARAATLARRAELEGTRASARAGTQAVRAQQEALRAEQERLRSAERERRRAEGRVAP